uniref:Endonuclease/exonuclease/phosphatase domain-containing protein n=1 Tax=Homalodisca liturata TaxID=320908 RepID=A0A1B6JNJ9_9HEMI
MCLEGYSLVGGFTRKAHKEGGVLGYAKKGLENQIILLNTSGPESELICETALFQITLKKEVVKVLGVYRPPSANLNNGIDILLDQLEGALQTKTKTILMGDVNVDNLVANSDNSKLEELLSSFDIIRESLPPTRITAESAKSIDWICTNIGTQLIQTAVIPSGLSDHTAQKITVQTERNHLPLENEKKRIFNKKSTDRFKSSLQCQNWDNVLLTADANQAYNSFHEILQVTLNNTCPLTTTRRRPLNKRTHWNDECTRLKKAYIQALERE